MHQGVLIAAERSGSGKTMITAALARALMARGRSVQCFKAGPDFIDPGYHSAVTGRTSRNLDGWMMGRDACADTVRRAMAGADICVVEGVMGLFDGLGGAGDEGSSAQIAKWFGLPVVLIVDGSSLSRSAGAVVLGFERFDPGLRLAGVIFNRVGSPAHFDMLRAGVQERCRAEVLGYIPRDEAWRTPERHLGLVLAEEREELQNTVASLARQLERTVDVGKILELMRVQAGRQGSEARDPRYEVQNRHPEVESAGKAHAQIQQPASNITFSSNPESRIPNPLIAVARDEAFSFCYQDNIDLLQECGADIVFFSPLHDAALPAAQGLYLPGGYPELHAAALAGNADMRRAVRLFSASGRPVYGECGGFLYLLESLAGIDGTGHAMAGVFPAAGRMLPRLQRLGYVEVEARAGHPFLAPGARIRGHEFHYSAVGAMPAGIERTCTVVRRRDGAGLAEGFRTAGTLAGYPHLHFASLPAFAAGFVAACAAGRLS